MHDLNAVIFLVAALVLLSCGWYAWHANRGGAPNRALLVLCLLLALGTGAQAFRLVVTSYSACVFWHQLSSIGWIFYPAVALHAAFTLTSVQRPGRARWFVIPLYAVAAVLFAYSITTPFGVEAFARQSPSGTFISVPSQTGWDILYAWYQYLAVLPALFIVWRWGVQANRQRERQQAEIVLRAGLLALAIEITRLFLLPRFWGTDTLWAIEHLFFAFGITYAVAWHRFTVPTASLAANYIVGHVKEMILLVTEEGVILQVNPTAVSLLGWGDTELVGRALPEFYFLPDTGQSEWPFPGCSLASEVEHDAVFRNRAGEEIPIAVTCSYLRDGYGDVVGIVVIGADQRPTRRLRHEIRERTAAEDELRRAHDTLEQLVEQRTGELAQANAELIEEITERERAEQALRRSEEKFRGLFEHMNEGANICEVVRDASGRVVDWIIREINPALAKTSEISEGATLGRRASEVLGSTRMARYLPFVSHVVTAHQPIQFEAYSPELRKHLVLSFFEVQREHFAMISMDITERKEAMQHLRESEEKYRGLFEHMNEGMTLNALIYDARGELTDWTVLEANYAVTQIIGLPSSQIVGRNARELFGEEQVRALLPLMATAAEGREPRVFEFYNPRLLRHLMISLFAIGPDRVAVMAMDITERKQAEEALRTSEERFRRIVETFPGMIWMTAAEPNYRALFLSDHVEDIFGYAKEEFLSGRLSFADIIFPDDLERVNAAVAKSLAAREPYSVELRFRHRAGHTVWVLEIGAGVYDDAGALQYLIGTALDITARKQTETALQESEWQYQALFAHMNEGFMLCEMVYDERGQPEDWIIDQMNPVLREMLGQAAESPVGKRGSAIFGSAEALAPLLPICAHVAETGVPSRFEAELPTLGKHVVASVFSPRIGRFAAVLYDITARKLAEDQVRVYQRELLGLASELSQAEERERRRIASDLHDSIIQNLALLQIMLGGLRAQADPALHATVDDARALLTASIQSARTLTFELSPPVLYELGLIAALEWIGEQMQQRHGLLVAVKAAGHFRLFSDDHRALLFSIVRELLVNIVKHARADQVTIHAEARDGMVAITVTDDGVGFDPAITEDQRSGYGLFSIRERLRHFGGTLTITSRPGAGTRVELLAPLQHTVSVEVE